jgi:hypothetical protein
MQNVWHIKNLLGKPDAARGSTWCSAPNCWACWKPPTKARRPRPSSATPLLARPFRDEEAYRPTLGIKWPPSQSAFTTATARTGT